MAKRLVKCLFFSLLLAALCATLVACGLIPSGSGNNGGGSSGSVDDLPVRGAIENVWYDSADNVIKWTGVEGSLYYMISFGNENPFRVYSNSTSVVYAQNFDFSVYAVSDSSKTATKSVSFSYRALSDITIDAANELATWQAVQGATGYTVTLLPGSGSATKTTVASNSYDLSEISTYYSYSVIVRANFPDGLDFSGETRINDVRRLDRGYLYYDSTRARFQGVPTPSGSAVYTYHLKLGDAEEITFSDTYYEYIPTKDTDVTFYATSDDGKSLRSEPISFTVFVLDPIADLSFTGTAVTWSPIEVEGYNVDSYNVVFRYNGDKLPSSVCVTTTEFNRLDTYIPAGQFVDVSVVPNVVSNACASESEPLRFFRKGSSVSMKFDTSENSSTEKYGTVSAGDNVFTLTGSRTDEAMIAEGGGFRLTLTKDGVSTVVEIPTEENAYTASYGNFLFEEPGTYTVTASPLYTFDEDDYIVLGADAACTFTITRAAPLTEAALYNHELKPSIRLKSSSLYLDEVVTKGDVVSYPTFGVGNYSRIKPISLSNAIKDGDYYIVTLPKDNDSQTHVEYSVTVYPRAEKIAKWEYSRENDWRALNSYSLRALTGFTVHYVVNGTVDFDTLNLNPRTNLLTWEYGEEATTHVSLSYKDAGGTSHILSTVTTTERELSFAEHVPAGTFVNGGTLQIYILGDPENGVYSCGQARTKTIKQLSAPVLTYYSSTVDYLLAKPNKSDPMDTEGYRNGDSLDVENADLTGGSNVQFIDYNIGRDVKFRYRSWSSFQLDSPWATYTVTAPSASTMTLSETGRDAPSPVLKISWTAKDNYSQYTYSITGGVTSSATVDEAITPNLYTLLKDCGRNTFHIDVDAVGHIDGENNAVYLQKRIIDDTFYTVNVEVSRTKDGTDTDRYNLAFEAYASPVGVDFGPLSFECTVRNTNNAAKRTGTYYESANLDLTSKAEEVYNSSHNNYLAVSIQLISDRSYLLGYKAFILKDYYTVNVQRYPNYGTPTYV